MRLKPRFSFSTRLVLYLSVVILLMFSFSWYITYRIHSDVLTKEISKQFSKANEQAAKRLDLQIRDIYRISNYIVFHPYVEQVLRRSAESRQRETNTQLTDQDELNQLLFQVKMDENKLHSMFLFDVRRNSFFFRGSENALGRLSEQLYEEIEDRLEDTFGNFVWFPTYVASTRATDGRLNLMVAARHMKNSAQEQYGTLVMLFDQSLFSEDLKELISDEKANVFLYDKQENLIYSDLNVPEGEQEEQEAAPFTRLDRSIHNHNGETYLYVKNRSGQADFTLVSRASLNDLQKKSSAAFPVSVMAMLLSVVMTGMLVTLTGKRLLRPVRQLVIGMKRIREGDLNVKINVQTQDELAFIGQSFNTMAEHMKNLIQEVYERQLSEREAELTSLQSQLNPHFLHNTLDTLYWKLYLKDDQELSQLVVALSEMLRYALEPAGEQTTLQEEVDQIRNYLTIQNTRFGHELEIIVKVDDNVNLLPVPRLILQPIVENVFTHAFKDKTSRKILVIHAYTDEFVDKQGKVGEALFIKVADNGKGMPEAEVAELLASAAEPRHTQPREPWEQGEKGGRRRLPIGVKSVIRRLNLMYGQPYGMKIESRPGKGTTIYLVLPKEA